MQKYKKKATLFLLSQGITLLGSSIVQFALIWYVTKLTKSCLWVSLLTASAYLPQFIISFFSGVWADKMSKKKLIIIADVSIAISTLILAIIFPFISDNIGLLIALVIISAIRSAGAGVQTPAVNSAISSIVPKDSLMKFNGINSTFQALIQFVAPAIAGVILSFSSLSAALMIDISTAAVGVGLLAFVAIPFVPKAENTNSVFTDMKEGFSYLRKSKKIRDAIIVYSAFMILCIPASFLANLFVSRNYGDSYLNLTLLETIGFIGMCLGGIIIGAWGGFKNRMKSLAVGVLFFGVLFILMGTIIHFVIYLVFVGIYGFAITMVQTASMSIIQEEADSQVQGRLFGILGSVYSGMLPLGMLVFGPLADYVSLNILMIISGALLILISIPVFFKKK